jgi:pimeloyl-ACP methyl ester carboxylesterase
MQEKEGEEIEQKNVRQFSEEFCQTHECQLPAPPLALMDAMAQAGPIPWRGIQGIPHYKAEGSISAAKIPTLLIRGEYDFCMDVCMEGCWKEKIVSQSESENDDDETLKTKIVPNCSHYMMLEDERLYGKEITSFLLLCDPK